jgi:hypothetical protein
MHVFAYTLMNWMNCLGGGVLFETIQLEKKRMPIVSLICKNKKATYEKFLLHIFEFGQMLHVERFPELVWKKF